MAENSKIEWTSHTFNPWRGCTKISPGCANCYAETLSGRNPKTLGVWGPKGTRVVAAEAQWREPLKWQRNAERHQAAWLASQRGFSANQEPPPSRPRVFCASLADVFEDWNGPMENSQGVQLWKRDDGTWTTSDHYRDTVALTMGDVRRRLFHLITATPNLDWLLLTKRPQHVLSFTRQAIDPCGEPHGNEMGEPNGLDACDFGTLYPNVWLGTSVENQAAADQRIPHLLQVPAKVRFLSVEPCLGPIDLRRWFDVGQREGVPGTSGSQVVLDHRGGRNLEERRVSRRPRIPGDGVGDAAPSGGQQVGEGRLPPGDVSRRESKGAGGCASHRVDVEEQERHPLPVGGQPQERGQKSQPPKQLGDRDPRGERAPQFPRVGSEGEGSAGEQEHIDETGRGEGAGDPESLCEQGAAVCDRKEVRGVSADCVGDSSPQDVATRPLIHWVIVGGESGSGARPMLIEWARSLIAQCKAASVPVFVKQLGARPIECEGRRSPIPGCVVDPAPCREQKGDCSLQLRDRKGGDMAEWPSDLRVREFPTVTA